MKRLINNDSVFTSLEFRPDSDVSLIIPISIYGLGYSYGLYGILLSSNNLNLTKNIFKNSDYYFPNRWAWQSKLFAITKRVVKQNGNSKTSTCHKDLNKWQNSQNTLLGTIPFIIPFYEPTYTYVKANHTEVCRYYKWSSTIIIPKYLTKVTRYLTRKAHHYTYLKS